MITATDSPDAFNTFNLASAVAKIKARIIPLFIVLFIANYIDRVNVAFVKKSLNTDLGIDAAEFGFGFGLFFIGYAVFEVPSNMLLQKFGARAWLTRIAISWGLVATLMAFVQNEFQFYVLRFLLGVTEAGFFPGVIYYFTRWLPAAERGKAVALFLSGSAIAVIVSGPLNGALVQLDILGLHGWQAMFIIEGVVSVLLGGLLWFGLDSLPRDAKWLTDPEKDAIAGALDAEQRARDAVRAERPSVWKMLADAQIIIFCLIYFAIQLTIYAVTSWLPTFVDAMGGLTPFQVGLYTTIPGIISIVAMYAFAAAAARWKFQQAWVATALTIAALGMFMASTGGPVMAFVSICFASIGYKAASSLFWPIPQAYLDARISAAVIALINSIGNLGGFVAPTVLGYLETSEKSLDRGLYGLALASLFGAAIVFLTRTRPGAGVPQPAKLETKVSA